MPDPSFLIGAAAFAAAKAYEEKQARDGKPASRTSLLIPGGFLRTTC